MSDLGYFLSCGGVSMDAVRIVEALEKERDIYRGELQRIADDGRCGKRARAVADDGLRKARRARLFSPENGGIA